MISKDKCDFLLNWVDQDALKNANTDIETLVKECFPKNFNLNLNDEIEDLYFEEFTKHKELRALAKQSSKDTRKLIKKIKNDLPHNKPRKTSETESKSLSKLEKTKTITRSEDLPWWKRLSKWENRNNNKSSNIFFDKSIRNECSKCKQDPRTSPSGLKFNVQSNLNNEKPNQHEFHFKTPWLEGRPRRLHLNEELLKQFSEQQ